MTDSISPGVAAIVFRNKNRNRILLHLRSDFKIWGLPGGVPMSGETFSQAVVRETYEETSAIIDVVRLIGVFSSPSKWRFTYPDGNCVHGFTSAFECEFLEFDNVKPSTESIDVRWFELSQLPKLIPAHMDIIHKAIGGDKTPYFD